MKGNITNEMKDYKIKKRENSQQTQYIMWPGQNANNNQKQILQPVNRNGRKKLKKKAKT